MCVSPVLIKREVAGIKRYQFVPCGRCHECLALKQTEFATRVMEEAKRGLPMYFITLTYSDEHVPFHVCKEDEIMDNFTGEVFYDVESKLKSLNNKDITLWKKRVRTDYKRTYGTVPTLNYAICGEYGPRTQRPHYHGIIFCDDRRYIEALKKDWEDNYGYTCFKKINTIPHDGKDEVVATAKYIAKYVVKLKDLEYDKVRTGQVVAPRKITSRGFGMAKQFEALRRRCLALDEFNYDPDTLTNLDTNARLTKGEVQKIIDTIKRRKKYEHNGKSYPLSKYLREKIYYKKTEKGTYKSLTIQDLVSDTVQRDANKDAYEQLRQIASKRHYENIYQACKEFQDLQDHNHSDRAAFIFQTNMECFRKSRY